MSANPPRQRVSDDEPTPERFARLDEPRFRREVVDQFHYLYYHASAQTWCRTTWLGVPAYKCPLDLWVPGAAGRAAA